MKEIYLIMSHSGTKISTLIKLLTRAEYSHVSIGFDSSLLDFYSFGRKKTSSFLSGGFIQEGKYKGLYKIYRDTKCKVYKLTLTEEKYQHLISTIELFKQQEHLYKYNYLGIFTNIFGFKYQRKNYYFCSQFVAELLHQHHVIYFNKHTSLVKPNDFEFVNGLELLYEGKLTDYQHVMNQ